MNEIGKQIKTLRLSKKLSQTKLAELSGMHQPYISVIESGVHDEFINQATLKRLATALGVELKILLKKKRKCKKTKTTN